ncbi:MAG: hypothetical protein IPO31_13680 [Candidatus Obscuribacter sp.]|nr:hypothetical protein [Candidatus Obscuribacter sp.]
MPPKLSSEEVLEKAKSKTPQVVVPSMLLLLKSSKAKSGEIMDGTAKAKAPPYGTISGAGSANNQIVAYWIKL